ncbi:SGNH/GDSL hydrolase family protein [Rhodobacteraceae bacterium]|nr:SGNH/GDSL hydrolase family protein [Paracoccaceae bacterium]
MRITAVLVCAALSGCVVIPEPTDRDARILAIGDSILAWNRGVGASVPDAIEARLGEAVVDASVAGAKMRESGLRASIGFSIPDQYRSGDWDAVVLNGGGNDLNGTCGCDGCDAVLNRLVREDYPALLARLGDTQVFILGYYGAAGDRFGNFDTCEDELLTLERRLTRLAATRPNVTLVAIRDAITGKPALYDDDRIHPSPAGSAVIGDLVARALVANIGPAR